MNTALGNIGEILTAALDKAAGDGRDVQFADAEYRNDTAREADEALVLTMVRLYRKPHQKGLLTLCAHERIAGDIIQGPFSTRRDEPTIENLERLMLAHRWVFNPIHMGDGKTRQDGTVRRPLHTIAGQPTISLMHRIETRCSACGHTELEWKDVVIMRSRHGDAGDRRVMRWSPDIIVDCNKCHCSPVSQRKLWCTAVRKREQSSDDPVVYQKDRDEVMGRMLRAWQAGPPGDKKPTLTLPRIWALYRYDQLPDTKWRPSDPRAEHLAKRAAGFVRRANNNGAVEAIPYPLGLLPFEVARQYHQPPEPISKALIEFRFEPANNVGDSPDSVNDIAVGWLPTRALLPRDSDGWRRRMWHDPKSVRVNTNTEVQI